MRDRRPAVDGNRGGAGATGTTGTTGVRDASGAASPDAPIETIERALGELARLFTSQRVHERRTSGSGVQISRTGLRCLTLVDRLGPVSVTKLATVMDLSQATASRAITALEAGGLLARSADPGDGRVTYCTTTASGRRALQRIQRFMYGQLDEALGGMTPERQRDLASTLTELVERLQAVPLRSGQPPTRATVPATSDSGYPNPAASSRTASFQTVSSQAVSDPEESTS
jgi:DNA-binding MarR family transcriptional regulator